MLHSRQSLFKWVIYSFGKRMHVCLLSENKLFCSLTLFCILYCFLCFTYYVGYSHRIQMVSQPEERGISGRRGSYTSTLPWYIPLSENMFIPHIKYIDIIVYYSIRPTYLNIQPSKSPKLLNFGCQSFSDLTLLEVRPEFVQKFRAFVTI